MISRRNEKYADGESEERRVATLRLIDEDNVVVPTISFRIYQLHYDFFQSVGLGFRDFRNFRNF